jgi:hypothetical protein
LSFGRITRDTWNILRKILDVPQLTSPIRGIT